VRDQLRDHRFGSRAKMPSMTTAPVWITGRICFRDQRGDEGQQGGDQEAVLPDVAGVVELGSARAEQALWWRVMPGPGLA
jgi:hypothetical protein